MLSFTSYCQLSTFNTLSGHPEPVEGTYPVPVIEGKTMLAKPACPSGTK